MKKNNLILGILFAVSFIMSSCGNSNKDQNGNEFKTVKIGEQIWMAENLNVDKFRNGDQIPVVWTSDDWNHAAYKRQPAWCYYNYDPENGSKYGKLYNWYAVNDPRGLAPEGWRIPREDEWAGLIDYFGGLNNAGHRMKDTRGWCENGSGDNSSGFSAMPGGMCVSGGFMGIAGGFGNFGHPMCYGNWWSSTEYDGDRSFYFRIMHDNEIVNSHYFKGHGASVRCVRE